MTYSSNKEVDSAQLLYTLDGKYVIWPEKKWIAIPAIIPGNTISIPIPLGAYAFFFTARDSQGLMVSSEYLLTSYSKKK